MKRRDFLKTSAVAAGAVAAPYVMKGKTFDLVPNNNIQSFEDDTIIIILELFGGNDGVNTIIPFEDDWYHTRRPILGYHNIEDVRRFQSSSLYFNKHTVDEIHNGGLINLMENGRLAIVEGVGYRSPDLSHFRSRDIWHCGINPEHDSSVSLLTGWLGRYLETKIPNFPLEIPEHPLALAVEGYAPLLFNGTKGRMGVAVEDPDKFYELGKGLNPKDPMLTPEKIYDDEHNFNCVIAQQTELYSNAVKTAYDAGVGKLKVQYSDESVPQKFKIISSLIAGGLKTKVYYMRLANFDSHAQQMDENFNGQHPTLLKNVASGICEFMDDAVQQGYADRVVGMTISEFGRRAYDNSSRGTDHGAANNQFVFGTRVNSAYFGNPPDLENLDEDGNVNKQFDFRQTYTDFLKTWFGADEQEIFDLFGLNDLGGNFEPIGLLKPPLSVEDKIAPLNGQNVVVYPNPSRGQISIGFELKRPATVEIRISDIFGANVKRIEKSYLSAGRQAIPAYVPTSGSYICSISVDGRRYITKFNIVK